MKELYSERHLAENAELLIIVLKTMIEKIEYSLDNKDSCLFLDNFFFENGLNLYQFLQSCKNSDRTFRNKKLILSILLVDLLNYDQDL